MSWYEQPDEKCSRHAPGALRGMDPLTQGAPELRAAFAGNSVTDRLVLAERGETVTA